MKGVYYRMTVFAESPELIAIATMSGVNPGKLATALSNPARLFDHLSLDDLNKIKASCERLTILQAEMATAMDVFTAYAKGYLEASRKTSEA